MGLITTNYGLIPVINPTRIQTVSSISGDDYIVFAPQVDVVYHIDNDLANTATLFAGFARGINKGQVFTFAEPVVCELVSR